MLSAAGDGELEPNALQEVTHHLTGCATCAVAQSDYSTIGEELRKIAVEPSLEGFTKSVLDVIAKLVAVAMLAIVLHSVIVGRNSRIISQPIPQTVASRPPLAPTRLVDVRVDSAFIADANSGAFSHTGARTQSGKMLVFNLPGGKTLHVMPRAISWKYDRDASGPVRRQSNCDDRGNEARKRRHVCAERRKVRRGHSPDSYQPDHRIYRRAAHSTSVVESITYRPRPIR